MNSFSILSVVMIIAFFYSVDAAGQATFVKKEFCKKSEVELLENNQIPDNYVIVGTSTFLKSSSVTSLEELSKKRENEIRAFARRMKSCHVVVDFSGGLLPLTDEIGTPISETHSAYYVLQPSFNLETKKAD